MKFNFRTVVAVLSLISTALPATTADLDQIKTLRLRGELEVAKRLLAEAIETTDLLSDYRIELHLEMARTLDRIGLHQNTRPVLDALANIDRAAELLDSTDQDNRAAVELAYADYYYRAEMRKREFATAEEHARRAISLYEDTGDGYGQADAVHRLGLIELQRHNLVSAEKLFRESLRLDIVAGERTFFRGEYERHVGFVVYQRGDVAGSVGHFERSLKARRDAGAIDASLFAAVSLALVLVELGRLDEAKPHIDYALNVAQQIESPVGMERAEEANRRYAAASATDQ